MRRSGVGIEFGPIIARELRRRRARPSARWHLDEMVVRLAAGGCISGAPSTMKVRSRHAGPAPARQARGTATDAQAAPQTGFRAQAADHKQIGFLQRRVPAPSRDLPPFQQGCGQTTVRRTHIKQCDDESARCSASSRPAPRSASSVSTPPSTISTFNATSFHDPHCGPFEPKRPRRGKPRSLRHEV
jgi:hypothetical protein